MFYRDERLALLIDGAHLYHTANALELEIDYKRLRQEFTGRGKLLRIVYFAQEVESGEYQSIKPLLDWLSYNGFEVVTKAPKRFTDEQGNQRTKINLNVDLAVRAMELAPHVQHIVLFAGDGDLKPLVPALQRMGCRVSIVSSMKSQPPMIADDLRRQADSFIELAEIRELIENKRNSSP